MSTALDMSLDDLIKKNKKSVGGNPRGQGKGSGTGPSRRVPNRFARRAAPYSIDRALAWQHGVFADQMPSSTNPASAVARTLSIETGTKIYVSNLDYGVSNEDIEELFSDVGDLKRHSIHYDRSGRSKGTAEVVFSKRADALAAVKRYKNIRLDGKPMKIEIVGTSISAPAVAPQVLDVSFQNFNAIPRSVPRRAVTDGPLSVGAVGGGSHGRGGARERGRSRRRGRRRELVTDLATYRVGTKLIN